MQTYRILVRLYVKINIDCGTLCINRQIGGIRVENQFELVSPYEPSGDQPNAIKEIVEKVKAAQRHQTLLGATGTGKTFTVRSEEHTSELQSRFDLVCRLLLVTKNRCRMSRHRA